MSEGKGKKKGKKGETENGNPEEGDQKVDVEAAVEGSGSKLPAVSPSVGSESIMKSLGMEGTLVRALDQQVLKRKQQNRAVKQLLDGASDDITRAKTQEDFAALDVARTEVLADVALEDAMIQSNYTDALQILAAKKVARGSLLDTIARRKKFETEDLKMQQQRIVLSVINKTVEVLTQVLKEQGIESDKIDEIVVKVSERSSTMIDGS